MAVSHLGFNDQLPHGRLVRAALNKLEDGRDELATTLDTLTRMIDGDGSQASHFTYMTAKCGFASDAVAKSAYEELQSLNSKFVTNANVADVMAAMDQAFAKFR